MHIGLLNDPNNFHTQKWGKALAQAGARVTVFSFDDGGDVELPWVQIPHSRAPRPYRYPDYLRSGPQLAKALNQHQVDLVNALNITPFSVWARQAGHRPLISSAMGADILEYPPSGKTSPLLDQRSWDNVDGRSDWTSRWKGRLKRRFFRRQVAKALHSSDLITGDNQVLVDAVRDWFHIPAERVRLLRWGVEPELMQPRPDQIKALKKRFQITEGQHVVLSPRGAKAIYQADRILDAFSRLLKRGHDQVHFIMLSAGYEIARPILTGAQQLQDRYPNFHFVTEQMPREEVAQLWHLTDILISGPIYDGYSAALAEARYAGVIPVVNAIPGNLELIRHLDNGWITDPFTPAQLTKDLEHILTNIPEVKERFTAKNRRWIEKHSLIKGNAAQFLDWCEDLCRTTL